MPPKHGHGQGHGHGQHSSGTSYAGGGGSSSDFSGVEDYAHQHAEGSADRDLFSSAIGMISGKHEQLANEDVDEQDVVSKYQSFFGGGDTGGSATSGGMGAAAAMQALKMYNSSGSSSSTSSGSTQNEFVGMAMGQAAKLFGEYKDSSNTCLQGMLIMSIEQQSSSGNVASGESKESAVQQAGEMALKMYMKSEMSGGSSGSSSGLMSLASKFMQ